MAKKEENNSIDFKRIRTSLVFLLITGAFGVTGTYLSSVASEVKTSTESSKDNKESIKLVKLSIEAINKRMNKFETKFNQQMSNTQQMICLMAGATISDSRKATEICNKVR